MFLQFICTNLDGSQTEWSNFLNLLQKEGVTQKGGGFLQKRQRKGAPTLEKTMSVGFLKSEKGQFFKLQNQSENFF